MAMSLSVSEPSSLFFPLRTPRWFTSPRPGQMEAVDEILSAFRDNGGVRVVIMDGNTGAGKTAVAESVRQHLALGSSPRAWQSECCYDHIHQTDAEEGCCTDPGKFDSAEQDPSSTKQFRALYVCSQIDLQKQFKRDYEEARVLMGKRNYLTQHGPSHVSCADCTSDGQSPCAWCVAKTECPYNLAKLSALGSPLAVTNMAYFLAEANHVGGFANRDLVICDEADVLADVICGAVEVNISSRMRQELNIPFPERKTKPDSWEKWRVTVALPAVSAAFKSIAPRNADPAILKRRNAYLNLWRRLTKMKLDDGSWVYSGYEGGMDRGSIIFQPVHARDLAPSWFFAHGQRFLLMSATVISPDQMAFDLGLPDNSWASVVMPSTFPPARSPIVVRPVADMTHSPSRPTDTFDPESGRRTKLQPAEREKRERVEWFKLTHEIRKIMARHPYHRILVHTVSFKLTKYLSTALKSPRVMWYENAKGRERALSTFRKTPAAVLLAPSLDRGISLDDDQCRVIIVAKMPRPSLGDKQVNARLHSPGGQNWYIVETIRTLAQSIGRASRSETDWSITYILDATFLSHEYNRGRHLLPKWFRARLDFHNRAVAKLLAEVEPDEPDESEAPDA